MPSREAERDGKQDRVSGKYVRVAKDKVKNGEMGQRQIDAVKKLIK